MRNYLKELRRNKSISGAEIAKRLSVSRQYYSMIENGTRQNKLRMEVAYKLSEILGIPLSKFIELENEYQAGKSW